MLPAASNPPEYVYTGDRLPHEFSGLPPTHHVRIPKDTIFP